MTVRMFTGDCRSVLATLPDASVQMCVTSPPYFGLRDYGTASWQGGDAACDHKGPPHRTQAGFNERYFGKAFDANKQGELSEPYRNACGKCGATRVDQQIGLESTVEAYVAELVGVFRVVRRVLRDDGVLFLNLGDSYAANRGSGSKSVGPKQATNNGSLLESLRVPDGLKEKDLIGVPWRVAFALQADGWVLRSEIIWQKPNPMPESVRDRPTKAHEQIFMFAKAAWAGSPPGRYADISDEDARWLALLFDTEGNIVVKKAALASGRYTYSSQVAFANTSRALLERARDIVGSGSIHERSGTNANMYYWQMAGREARDLLHRIYPHLIIKQRQARVAIHMQDIIAQPGKKRPGGYRTDEHTAFLDKCWATVKSLNRFGDPDLSWVPNPRYGGWSGCHRYFWDAEAVKEENTPDMVRRSALGHTRGPNGRTDASRQDADTLRGPENMAITATGRNIRSVWTIATAPFAEAHFATFPPALAERCIKAGTSEKGACSACGAPWVRVLDRFDTGQRQKMADGWDTGEGGHGTFHRNGREKGEGDVPVMGSRTAGWEPSCTCFKIVPVPGGGITEGGPHDPLPCVVLDPFGGAGTVSLVAERLGRDSIYIDLSESYARMAEKRIRGDAPMFASVELA